MSVLTSIRLLDSIMDRTVSATDLPSNADYTGSFYLSSPDDNCDTVSDDLTGMIAMVRRNSSSTCHPAKQAWFVRCEECRKRVAATSGSNWRSFRQQLRHLAVVRDDHGFKELGV